MKRRSPLDSVFFSLKIPIFILGNLILKLEIMAEEIKEELDNVIELDAVTDEQIEALQNWIDREWQELDQ